MSHAAHSHDAAAGHAGHHDPKVPRGALLAAAALLSLVLVSVAGVRLSGVEIREPDAAAVAVRLLRFEDRPDGSIAVIDAASGAQVERIDSEGGFLRGAMRVMARERRMRGLGHEAPFELIGRADGRLTLVDPATRQIIDIESFGPTNAASFARLLAPGTPTAQRP